MRAELNYRRMPYLPDDCILESLPPLSIIIPARNEASNLPSLLSSLKCLDYPGELEILVVDDHSSDQTGNIAKDFGARVVRLEQGIPPGWLGKSYACHRGSLVTKSSWLLFTDADTVHTAEGITRAVSYALLNGLDGLSLFLHQKSKIWSDRLTLGVAHAGLFAGQHPSNHILNGQFILLRRSVYLESGGFEAVSAEPLEDVALGNRLYSLGYQVPVLNGENVALVRMYQNHQQMFLGMSRLASASLTWERSFAILTVLLITALMSPLIVQLGVLRGKLPWGYLPLTWSAASISVLPWARRLGGKGWWLLAPMGGLLVQVAGVYGLVNRLLGRGIGWKDRKV
jgi:glycosyltransferase involved in cell wall biosynthesis